MGCHVEPKAKHLAFVREIPHFRLRQSYGGQVAQDYTPHFIYDGPIALFVSVYFRENSWLEISGCNLKILSAAQSQRLL